MMNDHKVSMPFFPSVSRKSCPIGSGNVVVSRSETEVVAKDAAMRRIHPSPAVPATPIKMASGAAREAPADSSLTWAAESSMMEMVFSHATLANAADCSHPVKVHIGAVNASKKAHPSSRDQIQFAETTFKTYYLSTRCYSRKG